MPKQISPKIVALTFGILVISFLSAFYVVAWQEPASTPPAGNVPAPLNVGSAEQIKTGNLVVNALGVSATGNALIVANGKVGIGTATPSEKLDVVGSVKGTGFCIGNDCRTSWPICTTVTVSVPWPNLACIATCPSGYIVTGGGYQHSDCDVASCFPDGLYPSGDNAWVAYWNSMEAQSEVHTCYARCCKF